MASNFLITGGAGFIGSHLTLFLAKSGNKVRILDNFSSVSRDQFESLIEASGVSVEIVEGDIRDLALCKSAVVDSEYVLHHAAMASVAKSIASSNVCVETNILGTTNMLIASTASKSCKRLVFASSSAVYGNLPGKSKSEDSPKDPLSPYATTKLAGEYLCKNYSDIHRLPTVALRYFNVFGPRQDPNGPYAAVIPKFIEAIKLGDVPTIYGDGEQSRDFISVDDIIQANLRACFAAESHVSGEAFNIGTGRAVTVNGLVKALSRLFGRTIEPNYVPAPAGDVRHSLANISKANSGLEFSPSVHFEEGLRALTG